MVKFSHGSNFHFLCDGFHIAGNTICRNSIRYFFKFKSRKMTDARKVNVFSIFFFLHIHPPPPRIYGFLSIVCGIIDAYLKGKSESRSRGWWVLFVLKQINFVYKTEKSTFLVDLSSLLNKYSDNIYIVMSIR